MEQHQDQTSRGSYERDRQSLAIYESYLRLKNGVAPVSNRETKLQRLSDFNLAFSQVRESNHAVARFGSANCRRFIKIYNDVGAQLSHYYGVLLSDPPPQFNVQRIVEARLRILHFFERALFGLILTNSEAGHSDLDPSSRSTCPSIHREVWTGLLLKVHQRVEMAHAAIVGEVSALAVIDEVNELRNLNRRYGWTQTFKQIAWMIGEVIVSVGLWSKVVAPAMQVAARGTAMGRVITYAVGSIYLVGWVAFDRYMRDRLTFLQSPPKLMDRSSLSSWDRLAKMAEDFLVSNLFSPPLYFAYAELLQIMRKEMALQFLTEHQDLLAKAEHEHGSIERAIEKLKEVLRHEQDNETSRPDKLNHGDKRLRRAS